MQIFKCLFANMCVIFKLIVNNNFYVCHMCLTLFTELPSFVKGTKTVWLAICTRLTRSSIETNERIGAGVVFKSAQWSGKAIHALTDKTTAHVKASGSVATGIALTLALVAVPYAVPHFGTRDQVKLLFVDDDAADATAEPGRNSH